MTNVVLKNRVFAQTFPEERIVGMVCQAATRTAFRALKHENGISGSTTIIIRVIACFQPLQDCQAEYFRHLLKPVT
ncbi:uncharacterized protein LOC122038012 isoform X2 [Zingiber officinale]|uniref:uncharacterized protein LOC122038012 isoform X2 n=1 Tax=Zingiber officinale TaxID=94328 RepID=UPI001C4B713F|nr:uncharacterized protein LOC122038012 isoform X2 [Zingiber officinale]